AASDEEGGTDALEDEQREVCGNAWPPTEPPGECEEHQCGRVHDQEPGSAALRGALGRHRVAVVDQPGDRGYEASHEPGGEEVPCRDPEVGTAADLRGEIGYEPSHQEGEWKGD